MHISEWPTILVDQLEEGTRTTSASQGRFLRHRSKAYAPAVTACSAGKVK